MKNSKTCSQLKVNKDFKENLSNIIYEHSQDYELYFVTFTFEDQFKPIDDKVIIEYFKAFYQKLNQKTVNNPSRYGRLKAKMILVPEKSMDNTKGNLVKTRHYHGILMVNKILARKFHTKCVLNEKEFYEFSHILNEPYFVKRFIFDPSIIYQRSRMTLRVYSTDAQKIIKTRKNITAVCSYITKHIGKFSNAGFNACDVLYFCDVSKTNFKNYKPRRVLDVKKLFITTDDKNFSPFRQKLKAQTNTFLEKFYKEYGLFKR